MQPSKRLKAESEPQGDPVDPRKVLVVFAIYVYVLVWLVAGIGTRYTWLYNALRPYLPDWALLVIGLSAPLTLALVGLRTIPWKISMLFSLILPLQGALIGLVGEKFRYVQGAVTLFAFFEAYLILPRWNRYIEDRGKGGSVLGLEQVNQPRSTNRESGKAD